MTDINLDPHLHTRIRRFCEIGDTFAAEGKYPQAIEAYQYAWNLLPAPKTRWEAATWLLAAIGDGFCTATTPVPAPNSARYCPVRARPPTPSSACASARPCLSWAMQLPPPKNCNWPANWRAMASLPTKIPNTLPRSTKETPCAKSSSTPKPPA